jgi:hypothetical protein
MWRVYPAKLAFLGVNPTRFELVTSAMRKRLEAFVVVRRCFEKRLFKPDCRASCLQLFVDIHHGNCQRHCQIMVGTAVYNRRNKSNRYVLRGVEHELPQLPDLQP